MASMLLGETQVEITPHPQGRMVTVGEGKIHSVNQVVRSPEELEGVVRLFQREAELWRVERLNLEHKET